MKKKLVISQDCLPSRPPVLFIAVVWLLLERAGIPGWGWGVYWTVTAITAAAWLISLRFEDQHMVPGFGDQE